MMTPEEINDLGKKTRNSQKQERKRSIKIGLIVFFLISLICISIFSDIRYYIMETGTVKALVVKERMHHVGRGTYFQTVFYEFEIDSTKYSNQYENVFNMKKNVGDELVVLYVKAYPSINKVK